MKRYTLFCILAAFLTSALSFAQESAKVIPGKVIKISDGDTVHFLPDSAGGDETKKLKIRMDGMDTPELHLQDPNGGMQSQGYWGEEAARVLAQIVPVGQKFKLIASGLDRYGRTLGKLINSRGEDINLEMVKRGWGVMYFICSKGCTLDQLRTMKIPEYRAACNLAVSKGLGAFNPRKLLPELPFEFRARIMRKGFSRFAADMKSKKYFNPNDYKKVSICDRLFFDAEEDARKMGFSPAR